MLYRGVHPGAQHRRVQNLPPHAPFKLVKEEERYGWVGLSEGPR